MISKILVVEDNDRNRELVKDVLEYHGFEVIEADNGEAAISAAKERSPDMILMDIQMPLLDGLAAAKLIKSDPSLQKIPMIALTSYAMKGDRERFLAAGFDDYIAKPIDTRTLPLLVKKHLRNDKARIAAAALPTPSGLLQPSQKSRAQEEGHESNRFFALGGPHMKRDANILLVDDDHRMSKTICDILKANEYGVMQAHTGDQVLALIRSGAPDCVLMDVNMLSGLNVAETFQIIKKVSPELPVVLMSALPAEDQIADARAQGAYTVIDKPIDLQMLLSFFDGLKRDKNVLIVDDDPVFSETLKDTLQAHGYRVEIEADPGKVLDRMEQEYKLAVILDLKLGDTDGLEVLRNIRAKYPTKPVILATSPQEVVPGAVTYGLQRGAYTCVYKSSETETLFSALQEIRRKKLCVLLGEPFEMPRLVRKK